MIPNVRSPDRRGKRDNPDPIWPGKGGAVPPADGRLKSLAVYLTTLRLARLDKGQISYIINLFTCLAYHNLTLRQAWLPQLF